MQTPKGSVKPDRTAAPNYSASSRSHGDISSILEQRRMALQQEKKRRIFFVEVAAAFLLLVLLLIFVISGVSIRSNAMSPTISSGDFGLIWKLGSNYTVGDIVLFRSEEYGAQVLRVVARQGDSVSIDSATGAVLVNGKPLEEPYVFSDTAMADVSYPVVLDVGEYFLLGDNRSGARDSRYSEIGPVSKGDIVGKLIYTFRKY